MSALAGQDGGQSLGSKRKRQLDKKGKARMARKERLTEEAKYRTELLRLAWATLIAVGAGTVVIVGMGLGVWRLHRKIQATLAGLEEV